MRSEPEHRGILAVDIEGFGRLDRSNPSRAQMRTGLHRILGDAITAAGIDPQHVEQGEYGDGVLMLVDPQVSKARLLHPLLARLVSGLARYNQTAATNERLRLRVVVHAGELLRDAHGMTGEDLIVAFRLLDSDVAHARLRQARGDLVLVVSDVVYQGIVKHGYGGVDPAGFQPGWVSAKETSARAWVYVPGNDRHDQASAAAPSAATGPSRTDTSQLQTPVLSAPVMPGEPTHELTAPGGELSGIWPIPARAYIETYQGNVSWVRFGPQVTSVYGYVVDKLPPSFWKSALHPADRDRVLATDEWCEQTLEPWRMTFRHIAADGRAVWLRDEAVVIRDETGVPRFWLGMNFHPSDRVMAELDPAHWLEAVDQLRGAFLAAASRQLSTPLASILETCRILEAAPKSPRERTTSALLRRISRNVGELDRLLTDVVTLQRLDWGAMALDRRPFNISALVERVAARWRADGRGLQISTSSATVWLDAYKVERIVHELLANAARHTPPGTPVWLRTRRNGTGILLTVEDAGPGLPRELQTTVLERSGHNGKGSVRSPAVGIGLPLVVRLAELHGGTAWIEDRPGGGTSVSVLLPGPSA